MSSGMEIQHLCLIYEFLIHRCLLLLCSFLVSFIRAPTRIGELASLWKYTAVLQVRLEPSVSLTRSLSYFEEKLPENFLYALILLSSSLFLSDERYILHI